MKPLRLFLVDDEPHVRMYLRTILKAYPVEIVAEGANGDEAITGFEQMRPDILFMDISMPQKTGLQALDEILTSHPDAKVVLLTSISDQRSIKDALKRGAMHYIRKDTPIDDIRISLQVLFDQVMKELVEPEVRNEP